MEADLKSSNILLPSRTRPPIQSRRPTEFQQFLQMLRMNVAISSWLLAGAFRQSLLVLALPITYAVFPPIFVLSIRIIDKILIALGLRNGLLTDSVIMKKVTAQIPNADSEVSLAREGREDIVVFLISAKSNHALGMFAPGFKELGDYFHGMATALSDGAAENGFLGQTTWTNTDRSDVAETLGVLYWRSIKDLHAFAHGPLHREGWLWWDTVARRHSHLAIYHEVYAVDHKHWETVYINCEPTGLRATSFLKKYHDKQEVGVTEDVWISPLVDASRGRRRTMLGRMHRGTGEENDSYNSNAYEK